MIETISLKVFRKGHALHPEGCVIVVTLDTDTSEETITEYTLEQWQELQQQSQ